MVKNPLLPMPDIGEHRFNLEIESPLEKGMKIHSRFLPGELDRSEEPGRLQSSVTKRGHD